jgi:hypothetical protein
LYHNRLSRNKGTLTAIAGAHGRRGECQVPGHALPPPEPDVPLDETEMKTKTKSTASQA